MQPIKIARWDEEQQWEFTLTDEKRDEFNYDVNGEYFSELNMRFKSEPESAWSFAIVTGHDYRWHIGRNTIDFESFTLQRSDQWEETDKNVGFMTNFTSPREAIEVTWGEWDFDNLIEEGGYLENEDEDLVMGDNAIFPAEEDREFWFVVNGKDDEKQTLKFKAFECKSDCEPDAVDE